MAGSTVKPTLKSKLQNKIQEYIEHFPGDLAGGITAAITSLPLSLAYGVTSGAGPIAGLYGTVCVGFFAAMLGGAPAQISGPTSPITALATCIIAQYSHDLSLAFSVVMLAGIMQVIFGYLRIGKYLGLIPTPVVAGFITGVGFFISIMQLGRLFGQKTCESPLESLIAVAGYWPDINLEALVIGITTMVVMGIMPKKFNKIIPSPLVALVLCTVMAQMWLTKAPIIQHIPSVLPTFTPLRLSWDLWPSMLQSAFALASLSSVYSLLAAVIADNVLKTNHNSDRELIGQGVGNFIAGMCGGLPGNGAPVRTLINISCGARTNMSGMLSAVLVLGIVLKFANYAAMVPIAMLAGLLMKSGFDIIDWKYIKSLRNTLAFERVLFVLVTVMTIFASLITALLIGLLLSAVWTLFKLRAQQTEYLSQINHYNYLGYDFAVIKLPELFSYTCSGEINNLAKIPNQLLVLDFSQCRFIDTTIALSLQQMCRVRDKHAGYTWFCNLSPNHLQFLKRLGVIEEHAVVDDYPALANDSHHHINKVYSNLEAVFHALQPSGAISDPAQEDTATVLPIVAVEADEDKVKQTA